MTNESKKFISRAILNMIQHNISIKLECKSMVIGVSDDVPSNGYFDDNSKIFACAVGKDFDKWFHIFIHEYAHFKQFSEHTKAQRHYDEWSNKYDLYAFLDGSQKFNSTNFNIILDVNRDLELEAEHIAVSLIKKYKLEKDIPLKRYIQNANAYIYFFEFMRTKRQFFDKAPYEIPEIIELMPSVLLDNYNTLPDKYASLAIKYCYKK